MILRRQCLSWYLCIFLLLSVARADDDFNCEFEFEGTKYNFSSLSGEHTVSRERETPPSKMVDTVKLDLCNDLKHESGVDDKDQCPTPGTRVCLTKLNKKEKDGKDRIVSVIPIAQTSMLKPDISKLPSPQKGLSIILHGPSYAGSNTNEQTKQSLNITLQCESNTAPKPEILSYDGSQLQMKWLVTESCGTAGGGDQSGDDKQGDDKNDETEKEHVGSGVGWFFLVILLAFAAYLVLGAYYNYSTYGASGMDLIPHRDFWKEVPYMLRDVVSHLCSSVSPRRSSRGGYISV